MAITRKSGGLAAPTGPSSRVVRPHTGAATATLAAQQANYCRENDRRSAGKGTMPLPEPVTFKQVVLMLVLHVCRKILFYDINYKVIVYLLLLLFGSIICDLLPLPRVYFSRKTNFLNVYFVKLGWGWTLCSLALFVLLSSYIYCCGERSRVRKHMSRLLVATCMWYVWTSLFGYIESVAGACVQGAESDWSVDRATCLRRGHRWYGFDISGHAFLLVYCNLVIMEEVRCMRGWERIGELLRTEMADEDNPVRQLAQEQKNELAVSYQCLGGYVKSLFIWTTLLSVLWDFMLVCTVLYFHSIAQKLAGGSIAIGTWFVTYRMWYNSATAPWAPGLPGQGPFKYADAKTKITKRELPKRC